MKGSEERIATGGWWLVTGDSSGERDRDRATEKNKISTQNAYVSAFTLILPVATADPSCVLVPTLFRLLSHQYFCPASKLQVVTSAIRVGVTGKGITLCSRVLAFFSSSLLSLRCHICHKRSSSSSCYLLLPFSPCCC